MGAREDQVLVRTERLVVRAWRLDEAPRLLDLHTRPDVARWIGDDPDPHSDPPPVLLRDLAAAERRIRDYRTRSLVSPLGQWAVEPVGPDGGGGPDGVPAGSVLLLELPNGAGEVEVGWVLHPDSQGRGWATEAARAVLAHGFANGLPEVYATTHPDNAASQAVCRRLGMRDLGVVRRWYEAPVRAYRLTRQEHAGR